MSARPPEGRPGYRLRRFHSALVPSASGDMAWTIGDNGFNMVLSSVVPQVVERAAKGALKPLWDRDGLTAADMGTWAVHPGGRAVLDGFAAGLGLPEGALTASRAVLARYGNMSSATILFVLRHLLCSAGHGRGPVTAVAFGPGLTVESALLDVVGSPEPGWAEERHAGRAG